MIKQTKQTEYYVSHRGEQLGPVSKEEILLRLNRLELTGSDYIFIDDKQDWITLEVFLAAELPNPMPTAATGAFLPPETQTPDKENYHENSLTPGEPSLLEQLIGGLPRTEKSEPPPAPSAAGEASSFIDEFSSFQQTRSQPVNITVLDEEEDLPSNFEPEPEPEPEPEAQAQPQNGPTAIEIAPGPASEESARDGGRRVVQLIGGVGEIELSHFRAETVRIGLRTPGEDKRELQIAEPAEIVFRAGPPVQYAIETPNEGIVGQNVRVRIKALDAFGNVVGDATEELELCLISSETKSKNVS